VGLLVGYKHSCHGRAAGMRTEVWYALLQRVDFDRRPSRLAIAVTLNFRQDLEPTEQLVSDAMHGYGYKIAGGFLVFSNGKAGQTWQFAAFAVRNDTSYSIPTISREPSKINGVDNFQLSFARN
jgi:putative Mg2+ transporter-C (MgtC) family protein